VTVRSHDEWRLLMQASIDGELDAASALDLERCLAEDHGLAAEYERLSALKEVVARHFAAERAPDSLRARVAALAETKPVEPPRMKPRPDWRAMAASAVVAAGLASGATWFAAASRNQQMALDQALIADHMRSLLATSPVDVVSSDRHTVKPWFDEHLAQSPAVIDLADKGFTLVGGRVDVVQGRPAPTLVYRLREHLISVTALRSRAGAPAAPASIGGYSVIVWQANDFTYWAVSDVERDDLESFVAAFRAAAAG
jgi:anti-sigma factor RsiW